MKVWVLEKKKKKERQYNSEWKQYLLFLTNAAGQA